MKNELERIKYVADMYEDNDVKIAFLLRKIEELVEVKNHYKKLAFKEK